MDWNNWKTWLLVTGVLVAVVAIYAFAGADAPVQSTRPAQKSVSGSRAGIRTPVAPRNGAQRELEINPIIELKPGTATNRTLRDLFAYVQPPVPKEVVRPVVIAPVVNTPPPPDTDKDTIPDFRDNCPTTYNPDQTDIDRNGIGAACQEGQEIPPPPPLPPFPYKYIGTFGSASNPLATFSKDGEVINVRIGQTFGGQFILRNIGIESVDIGYTGRSEKTRIPIGQ